MSNVFNLSKFAQTKKKKKSRGNPFRVLMGKVGKLLDHGLQKREIVRYLKKEGNWNEDTISKAVGIVKDYNTKKRVKKDVKEVTAQTLRNTAEEWPRIDIDYAKRSSAELIASILWLNSLDKLDPIRADIKEVEDRAGVKGMIRQIKAELLKRGMSEAALNLNMK